MTTEINPGTGGQVEYDDDGNVIGLTQEEIDSEWMRVADDELLRLADTEDDTELTPTVESDPGNEVVGGFLASEVPNLYTSTPTVSSSSKPASTSRPYSFGAAMNDWQDRKDEAETS